MSEERHEVKAGAILQALAFFKSAILSGEDWTAYAQWMFDGALAEVRTLHEQVDQRQVAIDANIDLLNEEYDLRVQLQEEVERLRGERDGWFAALQSEHEARNAAEARVAELGADRERLEWLEAQEGDPKTGNVILRCSRRFGTAQVWTDNEEARAYPTLREAIDAARRALDTKGGE